MFGKAIRRTAIAMAVASIAICLGSPAERADEAKPVLKIMTEDLSSGPAVPNERTNPIFTRGVRALKVDGLRALFASDRAGVVASVQIGK